MFDDVRVEPVDGTLLVPDAQPLVDYLASTFHFADREDDGALDEIRARVQAVIDARGCVPGPHPQRRLRLPLSTVTVRRMTCD